MELTIIVGSHRQASQSSKVGDYISKRIESLELFKEVNILNLAETDIPFWDEGVWKGEEKWKEIWSPIESKLSKSDAFIIITPEWGGMVPSKLKNLLLLASSNAMGNKPALIVSVSAGLAGSYPVNELRTSGYKNTKICYIPEHIIVRKVEESLNSEPNLNSEHDTYIRSRIDYALKLLGIYSENFKGIRNTDFNFDEYKFGM